MAVLFVGVLFTVAAIGLFIGYGVPAIRSMQQTASASPTTIDILLPAPTGPTVMAPDPTPAPVTEPGPTATP